MEEETQSRQDFNKEFFKTYQREKKHQWQIGVQKKFQLQWNSMQPQPLYYYYYDIDIFLIKINYFKINFIIGYNISP